MKKIIAVVTLLAAQQSLFACQVVVTNTTRDAQVTVFDQDSNQTVHALEGQAVKGNANPDLHAHLIITITHAHYPVRIYKLNQFACSKSHEIPVTSTQIIHGLEKTKMADDMDLEKLLTIEQVTE